VAPARRLEDRSRLSLGVVELAVAAISVGLQDAGPGGEMLPWMLARAVARLEEQRRRRRPATERPVVARHCLSLKVGPLDEVVGADSDLYALLP